MPIFTNQATLTFNGNTYVSNITTGELIDSLTITKTAITSDYSANRNIAYAISMVNNGSANLTDLTLTDNLGAYRYNGNLLTPLTVNTDSIKYFINGVLQPANTLVVNPGPPLTIQNIVLPAESSVIILYEAETNAYTPLETGSVITNTVNVFGIAQQSDISATETVTVEKMPALSINKFLSPTIVTDNTPLTYTFLIQNTGNDAAVATDNVIITDTFDPRLTDITVVFNGTAWTEGIQYTYNEQTGEFSTLPGAITVPAAVFTQDRITGVWSTTPASSTLVITGTV